MRSDRTLLLLLTVVVIGVGLTAVLFIGPNYREAKACGSEVANLHTKIETLEIQARLLDQLQDELASAQYRIANDLKTIPESADLASLMRKLSQDVDRITVMDQTFTAGSATEAIAAQKDSVPAVPAESATLSPSRIDAGVAVQAMPLTVDMESSFEAVLALIRSAETLNRLVRITSVRLTYKHSDASTTPQTPSQAAARGPNGGSPILKASVGMEVIFQPSESGSKNEGAASTSTSSVSGTTATMEGR